MKLSVVVEAVHGLNKIYNAPLPFSESYRVMRLTAALRVELDLYNREREKLFTEFGEDRDGRRIIRSDATDAFNARLRELCDTDVSPSFEPAVLCTPVDGLTPAEITALLPFVRFKVPGTGKEDG